MSYMFFGVTNLKDNGGMMSQWNTSNVTDMSWMFSSATNFNENI